MVTITLLLLLLAACCCRCFFYLFFWLSCFLLGWGGIRERAGAGLWPPGACDRPAAPPPRVPRAWRLSPTCGQAGRRLGEGPAVLCTAVSTTLKSESAPYF